LRIFVFIPCLFQVQWNNISRFGPLSTARLKKLFTGLTGDRHPFSTVPSERGLEAASTCALARGSGILRRSEILQRGSGVNAALLSYGHEQTGATPLVILRENLVDLVPSRGEQSIF
jgi:hypothetical protein